MKIAIITINKPSLASAKRLKDILSDYEVDIFSKEGLDSGVREFKKLDDALKEAWEGYDAIIAILALGAVVRKLAPFLRDKATDPAVVVVNLALDRVIPLIGGHLGGANELAEIIVSRIDGAINFLTTATDQKGVVSFDSVAKDRGWRIVNLKALANVSNRLLNGDIIKVATIREIFDTLPSKDRLELVEIDNKEADVLIYPNSEIDGLIIRPKLYIGIGCNRDTPFSEIKRAFELFCSENSISPQDIKAVGSFEAKRDERGIIEFGEYLGVGVLFFDDISINSISQRLSPSKAQEFFAIKGVAEPSAILVSNFKELIFKKRAYFGSITIAGAI